MANEGTGGRRARVFALAWGDRDTGGRAGERPFAGLPGRVAEITAQRSGGVQAEHLRAAQVRGVRAATFAEGNPC